MCQCSVRVALLVQALGIYRRLGERLGEANTVADIAVVQLMTGDHQGAARALAAELLRMPAAYSGHRVRQAGIRPPLLTATSEK
jgi:hypothetical protein